MADMRRGESATPDGGNMTQSSAFAKKNMLTIVRALDYLGTKK
jgi:hypothetical protein